jgi:hypothetical protein
VDLAALVSMSLSDEGGAFFEDDTLHRMVKILLNENSPKSDYNTKLDVLTILANLAKNPMKHVKDEVCALAKHLSVDTAISHKAAGAFI